MHKIETYEATIITGKSVNSGCKPFILPSVVALVLLTSELWKCLYDTRGLVLKKTVFLRGRVR